MAIYQTRCCSRHPAEVFVLGPSLQLQWLSRPAPGQPPRPSQPITIIVNPPPGAVQTTRINCRHDVWKRVVSSYFLSLCIHKKMQKIQSLNATLLFHVIITNLKSSHGMEAIPVHLNFIYICTRGLRRVACRQRSSPAWC